MANDYYGPCLPPGFKVSSDDDEKGKDGSSEEEPDIRVMGPKIPKFLKNASFQGPQLPPDHLKRSLSAEEEDEGNSMIGPKIPRFIQERLENQKEERDQESGSDGVSDDDDFIGPMPAKEPNKDYDIASIIDKRAEKMKDKLLNNDKNSAPLEREEWMTELPIDVGKKIVGVGPSRGFSMKPNVGDYDREGWTQTPGKAQKVKSSSGPDRSALLAEQARDRKQEEIMKEYTKGKKQESLMDMHQKKLKEKKKEDAERGLKPKRKEFDRDAELAILQFDPTKTRKVIQNSRQLTSRFSSGSQKFL